MKAVWNGEVVAESDETVVVDGNHYFPPSSLKKEFFQPSDHTTVCGWKGTASYYDLTVKGEKNPGSAWFYPDPKEAAENLRDHVAFWKGVEVTA